MNSYLEDNINFIMKKGNVDYNIAFGRFLLGKLSEEVFNEYLMSELPGDEQESITKFIKEFKGYGITFVEYQDEFLHITTVRPGIIIGSRGYNINRLEEFLMKFTIREGIPFKGIKLKEENDPLEEYIFRGYNLYKTVDLY